MSNKPTYVYYVLATSDCHDTYCVCATYKEALAKRKEMKKCLYGNYKFSIEKEIKY